MTKEALSHQSIKDFESGHYGVYEDIDVVDFLRGKGFDSMHLKESIREGADSPYTTLAVFDPANIRSVNAKFNPANKASRDILGAADPKLLAAIGGGGGVAATLAALRNRIPSQMETAVPENQIPQRPEPAWEGVPEGWRSNAHKAGMWLKQNLDAPQGGTWFEGTGDYLMDLAEGQKKDAAELALSSLGASPI